MSAHNNRRDFLKKTGIGFLFGLPSLSLLKTTLARAQSAAKTGASPAASSATASPAGGGAALVMIKMDEPQAKALGYREDAKKVDAKKWPKRAGAAGSKQFCYNCMFYKASGNPKASKAAPCTIFANKGVTSHGWCSSWTQNPTVQD